MIYPQSIDHLVLTVTDISKTVAFDTLLGMEHRTFGEGGQRDPDHNLIELSYGVA